MGQSRFRIGRVTCLFDLDWSDTNAKSTRTNRHCKRPFCMVLSYASFEYLINLYSITWQWMLSEDCCGFIIHFILTSSTSYNLTYSRKEARKKCPRMHNISIFVVDFVPFSHGGPNSTKLNQNCSTCRDTFFKLGRLFLTTGNKPSHTSHLI